ncbi:MAG: NAD(P)/FAD-dependent oxidoreductase [Nitrospiraceae bacterium]|nr:MAG: NAD(P)/FAD-dependent oxidoreductase [Nitrospiraceae bacterium]
MNDFDAIIIGSGIGGLVSAGILTSGGLKTLVIEKHIAPGGYISSFKRKGFVFDSAVDCISGVAPGGLIHRALELLGVNSDINFIKVDPIRVSIFPDIEIRVDADVNAYMDRLASLFPSEAKGVKKFFQKISSAYEDLQFLIGISVSDGFNPGVTTPDIFRLMDRSYEELLNDYFTDKRLKAVLSDRCPFIGLPPSQVSAVAMVSLMMSYFKLGAYRPEGCFQKLADVFVEGIRKNGGMVFFGSGVKKIILDEGGRCRGVICDNNEEYSARHVISNADFNQTFSSLLGGEYLSVAEDMIRSPGISTSFFILYAGIKGDISGQSSIGYFPSYEMEDFFMPDMSFREDTTIGVTIASLEDKSRAPEGCSTAVFHEMTEASSAVLDKAACTEKTLKKAEKIFPGFKDKIEVLDAATPQTLQRYTGNFNGSAFGWRQIPGRRGTKKHGIGNMRIAGHWGDMGSGVLAAAYSGARAAVEILAEEGIKVAI